MHEAHNFFIASLSRCVAYASVMNNEEKFGNKTIRIALLQATPMAHTGREDENASVVRLHTVVTANKTVKLLKIQTLNMENGRRRDSGENWKALIFFMQLLAKRNEESKHA